MDEISPFVKTKIVELNNSSIKTYLIDPIELNIINKNKENLKGKNAEYNAQKIIDIFKGEDNEFSDSVSLNVAAGLLISNRDKNFKNAYKFSKQLLKSGKVFEHLKKIPEYLMKNILEEIIKQKKKDIEITKKKNSLTSIENKIKSIDNFLDFKKAIITNQDQNKVSLIAEIKKASPSAGIIVKDFDHLKIAKLYSDNNATCFVCFD